MKKKKTKSIRLAPNFLDFLFIRDPEKNWVKNEKGLAVIDLEHHGFYAKIAQTFFRKPKVSHISLDRYGTLIWEHLDGSNTVGDLIHIMEETFPDEMERMPDRTITFLRSLQSSHFIRLQSTD